MEDLLKSILLGIGIGISGTVLVLGLYLMKLINDIEYKILLITRKKHLFKTIRKHAEIDGIDLTNLESDKKTQKLLLEYEAELDILNTKRRFFIEKLPFLNFLKK